MEPEPEPEPITATSPAPRAGVARLADKGHSHSVLTIVASPADVGCLASGGEDGAVCIWDTRTGTSAVQRLECFGGQAVSALCYCDDGSGGGVGCPTIFAGAAGVCRA